tara:strand:- start:1152 stop:1400 length:249 start_codon:yes stop_codon:yes gene_type:complete
MIEQLALRIAIMFGAVYTALGLVAITVIMVRSWRERNDHQIVYHTQVECPACDGNGEVSDDVCSLCDGDTFLIQEITGHSAN